MIRRNKRGYRWQRFFYSPLAIVLCAVLTFLLLRSVWQVRLKQELVVSEKEAVESELKQLEERKKTLEANLQFLSTARSVEAEIRSKFFVAKEGEKVIAVMPAKQATSGPATSTASWLQRWEDFWAKWGSE